MFLPAEIIRKKRDGLALSDNEIKAFVKGICDQSVNDAQIAGFTMSVWFNGMNAGEQTSLTLAMRDSGKVLAWPDAPGPILDKHSTGGVGDLVSLLLGPLIAACGGFVPMISGRGLGHTGGTLDKLESIPGFDTALSQQKFQQIVRKTGLSIIGQTSDLAPADQRIYAVRDVTATVASVPLIVSSILSKKLAEGLDSLVMDIKVGNGAFMQDLQQAENLATEICRVSAAAGTACNAVVTDMSRPIAWAAGNALEVKEAIRFLRGDARHERLHEVVSELSAELLVLGEIAANRSEALDKLEASLTSGRAAEKFSQMVREQGGPGDLLQKPDKYFETSEIVRPVMPEGSGRVRRFDMQSLGLCVVQLGGGRRRVEDPVDFTVGLAELCTVGDEVGQGAPLAIIHARDEDSWELAAQTVRQAISIDSNGSGAVVSDSRDPVVKARIKGEGIHAE